MPYAARERDEVLVRGARPGIGCRPPALDAAGFAPVGSPSEHDLPRIGEIGDVLESGIAGTERIRFAASDHFPNRREPERFERVVLEFLQRVSA